MKTKAKPKKYSVLLLYPDYVTDSYGQETYYDWVKAHSPVQAVEIARKKCIKSNDISCDPDDLFVHLVIEGHHMGLAST